VPAHRRQAGRSAGGRRARRGPRARAARHQRLPRVYGQLYARFGITSYKNLRREKYEQALAWLQEWYSEITGEPA
jgi:hypothetical protein